MIPPPFLSKVTTLATISCLWNILEPSVFCKTYQLYPSDELLLYSLCPTVMAGKFYFSFASMLKLLLALKLK